VLTRRCHLYSAARYMPIDTTVLWRLAWRAWRDRKQDHPDEQTPTYLTEKDVNSPRRYELWTDLFKLDRLRGVGVPDMTDDRPEAQGSMPRGYRNFIQTDGYAASLGCYKQQRTPGPAYTPETVPIYSHTKVVSIDPGENNLATWVSLSSEGGLDGEK
jgi:hypothetical protein